jgi:predicted MFS family arabinose efflux permease
VRNRSIAWSVIYALAFVSAVNQLLWLAFVPATNAAALWLNGSADDIGWLAEIFPLMYVVLAVPAGALLDRWPRSVLAIGAVLTGVAGAVRLVNDDYSTMFAGAVLASIAQPLISGAVNNIARAYLAPHHRPLGVAVGSAGAFVGMVAALTIGTAFDTEAGLPTVLVVDACCAIAAAVLVPLCLLVRPQASDEPDGAGRKEGFTTPWRDPQARLLGAIAFFGFGVFIALTTWLQALLAPAGASGGTAGLLLLVMVIAGIVGSVTIAPLMARRGMQSLALRACGLITALAMAVLALHADAITAFVVLLPVGFVLLAALPVLLELAELVCPIAPASATALIWMAGNAGGIVISLGTQALLGHPPIAFAVLAMVASGGVPLAIRVRNRQVADEVKIPIEAV